MRELAQNEHDTSQPVLILNNSPEHSAAFSYSGVRLAFRYRFSCFLIIYLFFCSCLEIMSLEHSDLMRDRLETVTWTRPRVVEGLEDWQLPQKSVPFSIIPSPAAPRLTWPVPLSLPNAATLQYSSACCGWWPPTVKWFSLLLPNCNFATVTNCNLNFCVFWWALGNPCERVLRLP